MKLGALPRHSKLDLESSQQSDAIATLTKSNRHHHFDANATVACWIPNQVWNDEGKSQ